MRLRMKRSEAIRSLRCLLARYQKEDIRYMADDILKLLEEKGMRPYLKLANGELFMWEPE